MASLQKIALYVFFDSIEQDLVNTIRKLMAADGKLLLTEAERNKARISLSSRALDREFDDDVDLVQGLDLGEKFDILMRHKDWMSDALKSHYTKVKKLFDQCITVRNTVMHGRPLTIDDYAKAFALTSELLKSPSYWPVLRSNHLTYTEKPQSLVEQAIQYLKDFGSVEAYNNLPVPDYEDTGFFPRQKLEAELRKKILGRHPVITVLGDGGDGKTAVTLQTLYGLLSANDHGFDAIIWVSAKSSKLTGAEIARIETEITSSIAAFGEIVHLFEGEVADPLARLTRLMSENKILLVIDNLETIIDDNIRKFAEDIPGQSKLILTSRIPLGHDLSVNVQPFNEREAINFLRVLIKTYEIEYLRSEPDERLKFYSGRLHNKPLLLKWFALGVSSGLSPSSIVSNPEVALRFCLENVFEALSIRTKRHLSAMALLPQPASMSVLEFITDDDIFLLEASLAEAMRFAIVEQKVEIGSEITFQIRPFAKAYLVRVMKSAPKDADKIMRRFRQIEGIFQSERGARQHDRYNPIHYIVRSKSEALAVKKLKLAVSMCSTQKFEEAFSIIQSLKVAIPDYFEVARVEAHLSSLSGDNARAQAAYLMAIELDESQPQLNVLYGAFLLKHFNDFEGALQQFLLAIKHDPKSVRAHIEASRTLLYLYDFEKAQNHIDRASDLNGSDRKGLQFILDQKLQILCRRIEFQVSKGDVRDCLPFICDLSKFLDGIRPDHLDPTLVKHIVKYSANLSAISRTLKPEFEESYLQLESHFNRVIAMFGGVALGNGVLVKADAESERRGNLKEAGRKPNYGFIADLSGDDTFVHKDDVDAEVWFEMLRGSQILFQQSKSSDGKIKATGVRLA
jgi:LuxR family glucitol operon transcriptional activator